MVLELHETHRILTYVDDVNLLGDNIDTKNLHRQLEKNPKLKHQLEK
jgi:hypothetical protein